MKITWEKPDSGNEIRLQLRRGDTISLASFLFMAGVYLFFLMAFRSGRLPVGSLFMEGIWFIAFLTGALFLYRLSIPAFNSVNLHAGRHGIILQEGPIPPRRKEFIPGDRIHRFAVEDPQATGETDSAPSRSIALVHIDSSMNRVMLGDRFDSIQEALEIKRELDCFYSGEPIVLAGRFGGGF